MSGILFLMHSESNTGYAIEKLEKIFYRASIDAGISKQNIHFAYPSIAKGKPRWMSEENNNFTCFNFRGYSEIDARKFGDYLKSNCIDMVFAFDLQPSHPVNKILRANDVKKVLSYWGAPISSENTWIKLLVKKLEIFLRRSGPDYYVFESEAMRELAVNGRGIALARTEVVPTGVDTERFKPGCSTKDFVNRVYDIPEDRKVFCYSGHMEERKGVHIIVKAMDELVTRHKRKDVHFVALGNKPGEEERFFDMASKEAFGYITFGGYRDDIEKIFNSSYAGIIASSGWDSWPMSVIEMGATGLPLLVSRLQGLREFVVDGVNGYGFKPGNPSELAALMVKLADNPELAREMSINNRSKVMEKYSDCAQTKNLSSIISTRLMGSVVKS